jgi:hypothetical protein
VILGRRFSAVGGRAFESDDANALLVGANRIDHLPPTGLRVWSHDEDDAELMVESHRRVNAQGVKIVPVTDHRDLVPASSGGRPGLVPVDPNLTTTG